MLQKITPNKIKYHTDIHTKRIFIELFGSGPRTKIIRAISKIPKNALNLANELGMDYKTIRHHLKILEQQQFVETLGEKYGKLYFQSNLIKEHIGLFDEITHMLEIPQIHPVKRI